MSKHTVVSTATTLLCVGALAGLTATPAQAGGAPVKCHLTFSMSGWSAIYQHAEGRGRVTCDNGQRAAVTISVHGGGLTAGKFHVNGHGDITNVHSIRDVFGSYAQAGASAGAGSSGTAQVLTKGTTSMALSGSGKGVDLGVAVDAFKIEPVR
ncbi:hypothetical protein [Paraburkholderia nemoris]|uniref:hypothetical protein n=1 Tax=Paraburkholderia nemoris TaxID=2793076 RepID=UPI0019131EF5|nr:hypothetical protein [Paraburkholderia nemoris]MBK5146042.1 hypothetical protein [Burkholderia sp. R-69608]CAE6700268.1 hypothetical protein R75777_00623 [Paraburkholderia nemoris]CAE6868187.1 hypothetical protein R69608_00700 [Paraburkholderia nemoris]